MSVALWVLVAFRGQAQTLSLYIRHLWGEQEMALPAENLRTPAGETLTITRLSYLLSKPALTPLDGLTIAREDWFGFVDLEQAPARLSLRGVPVGVYQQVSLQLGLDAVADASDPNLYPPGHPLNPQVNSLHWTPQGGYIFLALEGYLHREGEEDQGFAYHFGRPENQIAISIPLALEFKQDTVVELDFHLNRLFAGTPAWRVGAQTSTHSRVGDPLLPLFAERLSAAFTLRRVRAEGTQAAVVSLAAAKDRVGTPYRFIVRKGFPLPEMPADFPLTTERVALGAQLFNEPLLSRDSSLSCASCHQARFAHADGQAFSRGVNGVEGTRNAMPLFNLAWKSSFFWDGRAASLREQVLVPIQDLRELHSDLDLLAARLANHVEYPALFTAAFGEGPISVERLAIALEQFLLTLTSYDSKFDRAQAGKVTLSAEEQRGFELFMTEYDPRQQQFGADCFHCHGGAFFTDHRFRNNGLPPTGDTGYEQTTGKSADRYKFSTPSLRNLSYTAPYMHDGRFSTLEEVVAHYVRGVHRSPTLDPNIAKHPLGGIALSAEDQAALVAFLKTLNDPKFATPLESDPTLRGATE